MTPPRASAPPTWSSIHAPAKDIAVTLERAAEMLGYSAATIRRAIRKTEDDGTFPPPLPAKHPSGGYRIKVTDLERWFDSLPDA